MALTSLALGVISVFAPAAIVGIVLGDICRKSGLPGVTATRTGYTLQLQGCDADSHGLVPTYQVLVLPPTTGGRAFCIDQRGLVRVQGSNAADECFVSEFPVI